MANQNTVTSISSDFNKTLIGKNTTFKGDIKTDTPILIQGHFEGKIESTGPIEVAESGSFNAEISCRELTLVGNGEGKINCSEIMRFTQTGVFNGDLVTKDLVVVEGAVFNGTCTTKR
ncbi:MAG: polymer-forming cytoskeletal protein [Firmicutes bacterium]|nr:polymer-forming cytoskeletal protein [Bacillota bacterium]